MTKWQYLSASRLDASVLVPSIDKKVHNFFFQFLSDTFFIFKKYSAC